MPPRKKAAMTKRENQFQNKRKKLKTVRKFDARNQYIKISEVTPRKSQNHRKQKLTGERIVDNSTRLRFYLSQFTAGK